MSITPELINELQKIIKEDFGEELSHEEARLVGSELVSSYETLIKLRKSNNSNN